MPRLIRPMLASPRRGLPHDADRYGWEFKWDGVRAITYVRGGQLRLLSRTGRDMTGSYPELAVLAERVTVPVILDGEIIAIRGGRPDFGLLQSRLHLRHPPASLVRDIPVRLYLFDLLHLGDESLLAAPYTGRRDRLGQLGLDEDPVRTPPWYPGDAETVLAASLAHGLEGVVGKPLASAYHPASAATGSRSRTSGTSRSSSAAGHPARAAAPTRSAPCCSASTTSTSCGTPGTSAPASPRPC
jgi:bifunctional non-homologous end joining protein LigD